MPVFDMRTVITSYAITNLIGAALMWILWYYNRNRVAGIGWWAAGYSSLVVSIGLMVLRGLIPEILSITVAGTIGISSGLLTYIGLRRFMAKQGGLRQLILLIIPCTALLAWFTHAEPSLALRTILLCSFGLIPAIEGVWLLLVRTSGVARKSTWATGSVLAAFAALYFARILFTIAHPTGNDFLLSPSFQTLAVLLTQMLHIALALSLSLMVTRNIHDQLKTEIAMHEDAEAILVQSEEKFSCAFLVSPEPMMITRLKDGKILDINENFTKLSGVSRSEALTSTTFNLDIWFNPEERERMIAELVEKKTVKNFECDLLSRAGNLRSCVISSEIIKIKGEPHIISVFDDVTDRKLAERLMRLRLNLWEFANTHNAPEFLLKALNEIEEITGSKAGCYYLIGTGTDTGTDTQKIKVWSSRTQAEYGKNGIPGWMSNGYTDEAIIRNQPEQKANLERELVIPSIRHGKLVSILGLANKTTDYTTQDAEMVNYIADLVHSVLEKKQADEEIRRLNIQLENQAMTDDLTGLNNRRAFFSLGEKELQRAARYKEPVALLMLDLDKFKSVNDTWGHEAGDRVLVQFARTIAENIRDIDLSGRLGGEEFAILLPNTGKEGALILAERLREDVSLMVCTMNDIELKITVSIGCICCESCLPDLGEMLRKADLALYRAKIEGRNRVVCGS